MMEKETKTAAEQEHQANAQQFATWFAAWLNAQAGGEPEADPAASSAASAPAYPEFRDAGEAATPRVLSPRDQFAEWFTKSTN